MRRAIKIAIFESARGLDADRRAKPLKSLSLGGAIRGADSRSIRAGDTVSTVEGGTFAVHLEGVTPELAQQVGDRICEQVKDLIMFDKVGGLITVPVLIGGVIGSTEREPLPLNVARENLTRARDLEGQKLLISSAA